MGDSDAPFGFTIGRDRTSCMDAQEHDHRGPGVVRRERAALVHRQLSLKAYPQQMPRFRSSLGVPVHRLRDTPFPGGHVAAAVLAKRRPGQIRDVSTGGETRDGLSGRKTLRAWGPRPRSTSRGGVPKPRWSRGGDLHPGPAQDVRTVLVATVNQAEGSATLVVARNRHRHHRDSLRSGFTPGELKHTQAQHGARLTSHLNAPLARDCGR